jgi:hypothetical protein
LVVPVPLTQATGNSVLALTNPSEVFSAHSKCSFG